MIPLQIGRPAGEGLHVLCLGAHADDIEIGCGGAILSLLRERPGTIVTWVVFSASAERGEEAERSAARFLDGAAHATIVRHGFRDGYFPYCGGDVKDVFEELKGSMAPDLIFTHHERDRHQDHRLIRKLTGNTFRHHLLLEYEIPKYDGDLRTPNLFVPIDDDVRQAKVQHLMECFASQRDKRWFSAATFDGLMRLRGVECASPTGYAEGFYARKLVLASR